MERAFGELLSLEAMSGFRSWKVLVTISQLLPLYGNSGQVEILAELAILLRLV
jgi:hypothetical protein